MKDNKTDKLIEALKSDGAFLVVEDRRGKVTVMTIGWAQTGIVWGRRIMSVLVRPSRYTHGLIENAGYFSVCVPPEGEMKKELAFCGSRSGRDLDKIRECGLSLEEGSRKGIRLIKGSAAAWECEIVSRSRIFEENTGKRIKERYYPEGDYHTVYYGEIIS